MIPKPNTQPSLLPLRLILLGAAAGCGVLASQRVPSAEWSRFLAGLTVVGADGTTLATAMASRIGVTMMLVLTSVVLAAVSGFAVSFTALRIGLGLPWLAGFFGRLLAAMPVVALGWAAVGWIVGENGWPIESLLPYHPAKGRDTWELALGRRLWWWLVPCWALMLPLTGEFISQTLERFRRLRKSDLHQGLHARGLKRSVIHYHHTFPAVWPELLGIIKALGLLALGYAVLVEEALGIPGWGSFFSAAIKSGDVRGIAGSVYAAGWMSAAWCLCVSLLRFLTAREAGTSSEPARPADFSSTNTAATAVSLALLVLSCCAFGEMPEFSAFAAMLGDYVSPFVHDLRMAAAGCAVALTLALMHSGLTAFFGWRLPRLGITETIAWSPLLVWTLAAVALMRENDFVWIIPGIAAAFGGAVQITNRWRELQSSRAIEGSRAIGTGKIRAWRMHVMPELFRLVLSWILDTAATLMVWIALIDSLKSAAATRTPESLGLAIAAAKENVLSDLPPLIVPSLIVAICALFFNQLSRIVRPGPPPH